MKDETANFRAAAKSELESQPLSIILQALSVIVGVISLLAAFGFIPALSIPSANITPQMGSSIGFSFAILFLISPFCALLSGRVYKENPVGGFCLSVILSNIVVAISIIPSIRLVDFSAKSANGTLSSPLVDLIYWSTVFVFFGLNSETIFKDWAVTQSIKKEDEDPNIAGLVGAMGLGAIVWGGILSAGQQKVLSLLNTLQG